MTEVRLYKAKGKAFKTLGLGAPLLLAGIWIITKEPLGTIPNAMGWICTCLFGAGAVIGLFHLLDKKTQILITENGIWDRTTNESEVKWEQVKGAYILDLHGQKFISLIVDDTFVFKQKQYEWAARINKKAGAQRLNLHLGQLKTNGDHLTAFILEMSKAGKESRKNIIQKYFQH